MNDALESSEKSNEETLRGRYLTFQIGTDSFGIQIRYVTEIVSMQPLMVMPEMPEYIKGIINLRGKIISVMDMRLRFGMPWREYDDRTCIIVAEMNGVSVGLVIDAVSEVITINDDQIEKKPAMSAKTGREYIRNIGRKDNQVILLIDCEDLLSNDEVDSVSNFN